MLQAITRLLNDVLIACAMASPFLPGDVHAQLDRNVGGELQVEPTLTLTGLARAASPAGRNSTPAEDGQWSEPFDLPLISIHSALLRTGKVLLFSAEHGVPGIHGWVLDPETLNLTDVPPPDEWNPDCAGHSFLPDGRLLVAGGTLQFNPLLGSRRAYTFDPDSEAWSRVEDMQNGRWYPTCITLPDGSVITLSGINDTTGELNPDIEQWDASSSENWMLLGTKLIPDYPYLHGLPSGLVFRSGPDRVTETYDASTDQWTPVALTLAQGRYEAPSVLLPPTLDRVMLVGGFDKVGPPTNSAEIIDLGDVTPQWSATANMAFARKEHNAVILPDGTVMVVGGQSNAGEPGIPVLTPEVFDPAAETWNQVAAHRTPLMYHSTAVLLPDGRVFAGGGDFQPTGQIYSPAYLFNGPRPVIQVAPSTVAYGTSFDIQFSSATPSSDVVLVRLSSVTHSNNMGQRYVPLAQAVSQGEVVSIPAPASASIAPPGYYMLFVVDEIGVPSIAEIVHVSERPADLNGDGVVNFTDLLILLSNWGPCDEPCPPQCTGDIDMDCDVNVVDLLGLLSDWG